MTITDRPRLLQAILFTGLLALGGCAATPRGGLSMADMDIVAKDDNYALVRLAPGQDFDDLAMVFLGNPKQSWQLREVNADHSAKAGQIVAVPRRPVNSSSVYTDGYRRIPILCYHQFTSKASASHQLELSAAVFEQQLRYLVEQEYQFLSFADVQKILQKSQPIPEKAVVITIDDGYRSVYDVAWPILKKYGIKTTLFIYTDFIGAPAALGWAQMREMADSGFVDIESHAKSHSSLSRQPDDTSDSAYEARVREEIEGSNRAFQKNLGAAPDYLSYPYGNSSDTVAKIARKEGIQLAATVTQGDNTVFAEPYLLHRTMIYDTHDITDFKKMVQGFSKRNLK